MAFLKLLWELWKKFAYAFGTFMSRVILTIMYFTVIMPWGVCIRIFSDPLNIKTFSQSGWKSHTKPPTTMQEITRQF